MLLHHVRVFGPQEDGVGRGIVDSGGFREMPIRELFVADLGYVREGDVNEAYKRSGVQDFGKRQQDI
jgi:hypothetical protein